MRWIFYTYNVCNQIFKSTQSSENSMLNNVIAFRVGWNYKFDNLLQKKKKMNPYILMPVMNKHIV